MKIDIKNIVSISEANQNFSKVAKLVEKSGEVVIFKNNKPKFKLIDLDKAVEIELSDDDKIDIIASRVLDKYRPAFEELAR